MVSTYIRMTLNLLCDNRKRKVPIENRSIHINNFNYHECDRKQGL